jgi:hypothetical protein
MCFDQTHIFFTFFLNSPPSPLLKFLVGFLMLFSYTHIKHFDHIHSRHFLLPTHLVLVFLFLTVPLLHMYCYHYFGLKTEASMQTLLSENMS